MIPIQSGETGENANNCWDISLIPPKKLYARCFETRSHEKIESKLDEIQYGKSLGMLRR